MKPNATGSTYTAVGMLLVLSAIALAQPHPPEHQDPLAEFVFEPELILENQRRIGLDDDQRSRIRQEILEAQRRFTELQWELEDGMETMVALLQQEPTDEGAVLSHLDSILELENEMKRAQLGLMIRLKNYLTADQREELRRLRDSQP